MKRIQHKSNRPGALTWIATLGVSVLLYQNCGGNFTANPGTAGGSSTIAGGNGAPGQAPVPQSVLEGKALYTQNCQSCHGAFDTSTKRASSFNSITNAINGNVGNMGTLRFLTPAQVQLIADALTYTGPTTVVPPTVAPSCDATKVDPIIAASTNIFSDSRLGVGMGSNSQDPTSGDIAPKGFNAANQSINQVRVYLSNNPMSKTGKPAEAVSLRCRIRSVGGSTADSARRVFNCNDTEFRTFTGESLRAAELRVQKSTDPTLECYGGASVQAAVPVVVEYWASNNDCEDDDFSISATRSVTIQVVNRCPMQSKVLSATARASDGLGAEVAIDGATAVATAPGFSNQAWVKIFTRNASGVWVRPASEQEGVDVLTFSVSGGVGGPTSLALKGNTLAIGFANISVGAKSQMGQVSIYEKSGNSWIFKQNIGYIPDQIAAGDKIGSSVSLIDANTLLIGAPGNTSNAGGIFMATKSGATWQLATRVITGLIPDAYMGKAIDTSIVNGTTYLIAGAPGSAAGSANMKGFANLYRLSGGTWSLIHTLNASSAGLGSKMGDSVAIGSRYAVVGAPNWASSDTGTRTGNAFAFELAPIISSSNLVSENGGLAVTTGQGSANDNLGNASKFGARVETFNDRVYASIPGISSNTGLVNAYRCAAASCTRVYRLKADAVATASNEPGRSVGFTFGSALATDSNGQLAVGSRGYGTANSQVGAVYVIDPKYRDGSEF